MIKAAELLFKANEAQKPTGLLMIDRNELEDHMLRNLAAVGVANVAHADRITTARNRRGNSRLANRQDVFREVGCCGRTRKCCWRLGLWRCSGASSEFASHGVHLGPPRSRSRRAPDQFFVAINSAGR